MIKDDHTVPNSAKEIKDTPDEAYLKEGKVLCVIKESKEKFKKHREVLAL